MNNIMKKSILLILILIVLIIGINIITSVKETKYSEYETGTINSSNAKHYKLIIIKLLIYQIELEMMLLL